MIIDDLPSLASPATGDEIPIERGTTTYKIDYNALAAAIINGLGGDPVTVVHGGTGATTAQGVRVNLAVPAAIIFSTATWEHISSKLLTVNDQAGATFYCADPSTASLLTGGVATSSLKGVVTRLSATTYDFFAVIGAGGTSGSLITWRISNLTASGGTVGTVTKYVGGTNTASAKAALGLGTSDMDFQVTNPTSSEQHLILRAKVGNSDSSLNGHTIYIIFDNIGVNLYDNTNSKTVWRGGCILRINETTWAGLFSKLSSLPTGYCAPITITNADATSLLTGGKRASLTFGTVYHSGALIWDFLMQAPNTSFIYQWRVTFASDGESATVGTVYRLTGTAV